MTCEEIYISRIQGGIRGIRMGTKTPETAQVGKWLNKLKPLNDGMHDELFEKYQRCIKEYCKKTKKSLVD
jgi:hypothetical protein